MSQQVNQDSFNLQLYHCLQLLIKSFLKCQNALRISKVISQTGKNTKRQMKKNNYTKSKMIKSEILTNLILNNQKLNKSFYVSDDCFA